MADKALSKALASLNIRQEDRDIFLKKEQEIAVKNLLYGRDVMAILPSGFGKSFCACHAVAKCPAVRNLKNNFTERLFQTF